MKITQITVSLGATLNLGNYNSLRLDVSATIEMDERQSQDDVVKMMSERLRDELLSLTENTGADRYGLKSIAAIATEKKVVEVETAPDEPIP